MQKENYPYKLNLSILGGAIQVCCKYKECQKGVKNYFSESIIEEEVNIDIVIYCDLEKADKYLFRTNPNGPIKGVYYETENNTIRKWDDCNPPIPPFVKSPFKNRFTGLHAGAVNINNKTILFVGEKESGKTTITTHLSNNFGAQFITDETTFILNRTKAVEPYPRLILPRIHKNGEVRKVQLSVSDGVKNVLKDASIIDKIYFLNKLTYETKAYVKKTPKTEAIKLLFENYLYAGSHFGEITSTLVEITKDIPIYQYNYSQYNDLLEFADEIYQQAY